MNFDTFWQQTFTASLASTGQGGTATFCAHSRTEAMLIFSSSLRAL
jgi:hypothetical protein